MNDAGKHLNVCPPTHIPPPGYDCPTCRWFTNGGGSDIEPGGYVNATFNGFENGKPTEGNPLRVANCNLNSECSIENAETMWNFPWK